MSVFITILLAIFVFGVLIFVHELGHFIAAKKSGIQVNEFAMGMGPKLISFNRGETAYSLRLFPIGGFCSMEGEDEASEHPRSFYRASWGRRFLVMAAGSIMNLLLGLLVLIVLSAQLNLIPTTQVHSFSPEAVSDVSLRELDVILRVNGRRVRTGNDLQYEFMRDRDGVMDMVVRRNGQELTLPGVAFAMRAVPGTDVEMAVWDFSIVGVEKTPVNVVANAFNWTGSLVRQVWGSFIDLLTGRYGIGQLSGPVGVTNVIGEAVAEGYEEGYAAGGVRQGFAVALESMFRLMAFIAVNLGVFNLLPLPALDGGKIFFLLIELVRRKPVPAKYEGWVHAVGFFLLIGLMVVVSIKDVLSLI